MHKSEYKSELQELVLILVQELRHLQGTFGYLVIGLLIENREEEFGMMGIGFVLNKQLQEGVIAKTEEEVEKAIEPKEDKKREANSFPFFKSNI